MKLSNRTYDILKWVALYLLPALGTLCFAVANIWNLPYGEEIVGTITAVDTFIAVIIGISRYSYEGDGTLQIDTTSDKTDVFKFDMNTPFEDLADKKTVTFKVDPNAKLESVVDNE